MWDYVSSLDIDTLLAMTTGAIISRPKRSFLILLVAIATPFRVLEWVGVANDFRQQIKEQGFWNWVRHSLVSVFLAMIGVWSVIGIIAILIMTTGCTPKIKEYGIEKSAHVPLPKTEAIIIAVREKTETLSTAIGARDDDTLIFASTAKSKPKRSKLKDSPATLDPLVSNASELLNRAADSRNSKVDNQTDYVSRLPEVIRFGKTICRAPQTTIVSYVAKMNEEVDDTFSSCLDSDLGYLDRARLVYNRYSLGISASKLSQNCKLLSEVGCVATSFCENFDRMYNSMVSDLNRCARSELNSGGWHSPSSYLQPVKVVEN
jgi:hypothetical protein